MKAKKTTSLELVQELTARNSNGKYDSIIERAKNNGYHDFKFDQNPLYGDCICPKMELHGHLAAFPELSDIRDAVANGDYDETADEADKEMMREWLKDDGESGERMIDILGLNKNKND